jgi:hypothetical protein
MRRSTLSTFALTIFCVAPLLGCGSGSNGPAQAAGVAGGLKQIAITGQGAYADGTPVADKNVQYQLIVDGSHLFQPGTGCKETPAHVAGTTIINQTSGSKGEYSLLISVGQVKAAVVRECSLQALNADQVTTLRLNASVLADETNCQAFCSAQPEAGADCVNTCSQGNRIISASKTLATAEVKALLQNTSDGTVKWDQPLVFGALGPPISEGVGPDLLVDGDAAKASAHVTHENFSDSSCEVAEKCVRAPGNRTLLRFDGTIQNLGSSDLILGDPASNPQFQKSSCHKVNLLLDIMLYELLDANTGEAIKVGDQAVIGRKAGFCMMDIAQINSTAPQGQYNCDNQGITAGWADVYDSALDCQFLDITDVAAGDYTLKLTVNPDGVFSESATENNSVEVPVHIPDSSAGARRL